ncbi:hypothetical protein DXG03_008724 [Asterophora parasitica]|uniref:Uncharacterized protein n=1 Tax=Asterophora parasitica TaxID=117018 RepID=A0A9P7KA77_9AGAR|nr:hypothetical protein DXG03_008724 [Asterophora parasitica]
MPLKLSQCLWSEASLPATGISRNSKPLWNLLVSAVVGRIVMCELLASLRCNTLTPCSNKAVADGGVSFYIDHFVRDRVAKYCYGIEIHTSYNRWDAEHQSRFSSVYKGPDDIVRIPAAFSIILPKVVQNAHFYMKDIPLMLQIVQDMQVSETREFRQPYCHMRTTSAGLPDVIEQGILCYRELSSNPRWTDVDSGQFLHHI